MLTKYQTSAAVLLTLVAAANLQVAMAAGPKAESNEIQIGSVSPQYTPTAGPGLPEPVSMQDYFFQVEKETGRARVVIDYTYPDMAAFGFDGGAGPEPTMAQLPDLKYDSNAKTVVLENQGQRTVCATVHDARFLFWKHLIAKPTGACMVTAQLTRHADDTGWGIRRHETIDTFLKTK